ncbi:MAG: hypothetical protein AVDCRST_MAG16-347, partial [uncultured Frankineae bacterium]
ERPRRRPVGRAGGAAGGCSCPGSAAAGRTGCRGRLHPAALDAAVGGCPVRRDRRRPARRPVAGRRPAL